MQAFTIGPDASGQRLDRYLQKLLPEAGKGFLQKMLRKKNIKLNHRKADGSASLKEGDLVEIFFSDETIDTFRGAKKPDGRPIPPEIRKSFEAPVFEDENFLAIAKPVNTLTQPDESGQMSLSEAAPSFIRATDTFSPAPITRLDRNTSGVLLFPKNYQAQKRALAAVREKSREGAEAQAGRKVYYALVAGPVRKGGELEDFLARDPKNRTTRISAQGDYARLTYEPVLVSDAATLVRIELITGRTHQIRAQFAAMGHPLLGDRKYAGSGANRAHPGLRHPFLHAAHYRLEDRDGVIVEARAPFPKAFEQMILTLFPKKGEAYLRQNREMRDGNLE